MRMSTQREALSRERILRAALSVVDCEGLEAISMRRLGEELGVEAMSLYNHVPNKAAILDGILEIVLAELPSWQPPAPWPAAIRARALALRAVLRAHPHVLPLFANRPAVTPASILHIEGALEVFHTAGMPMPYALGAFQVVVAFVVGHTIASYAPRRQEESQPQYEQLSPVAFPRVREAARLLPARDLEKEFELGLDAMLAGLDTLLSARRVRQR